MDQTTETMKILDALRTADIGIIKTNLLAIISDLSTQNTSVVGLQTRWDANKERVTLAQRSIGYDQSAIHDGKAFALSGVLTVAQSNFGAVEFTPHAKTAAAVTLDLSATLSDLTFTAVDAGVAGNAYTVEIVSLLTADAPLAVTFNPITKKILISAGCDNGGAISSTALEVKTAYDLTAGISTITCAVEGDGSGVVNVKAEAPLTGGTEDKYVHLKPIRVHGSVGPVTATLYEDYTITSGGATVAGVNRRRTGTPTASVSVIKVLTDAAKSSGSAPLTLDSLLLATATPDTMFMGASDGGQDEWVLKPGVHYLLSLANGGGSASDIGYQLFWCEEDTV